MNIKSDTAKGYLFALVGTIAFSNEYIFSKAALNEVHLTQFGVYWFLTGTILTLLYSLYYKKLMRIKFLTKNQYFILVILGLLEIITATTFYLSIHIIPNPAVTSFLGNMFPVMLMLGGVTVLGEKFGPVETAGVTLAITGAFIVSYTGEASLKIFIPGAGIVLLNAFFATTASLIIKVHVKNISPELLNLNRSLWLLLFSVIMLFIYRQPVAIPLSALKNIAIGAILGPFVAILTIYYSFRYIEASRSSIIQSLKGIFVLIGSFLFFGTLPLPHQILGGGITIAGVMVMSLGRSGLLKIFNKKQ
ncbi:MAG: DMT family transporter [Prolixibacteraceae bacterium]|jgi:drug/metabolite transporter (DMT)-like permease|nr:DMT family transporter [Prolixibacteraceae bacterium]